MYFHNILSTLIAWDTWLWNIIFMLKVRWLREKDSSSCLITIINVPEVFYFAVDWIWRSPTGSWVWRLDANLVTLHVEAVASLWREAWLVVLSFECYNPFLQAELSASWSSKSLGTVTSCFDAVGELSQLPCLAIVNCNLWSCQSKLNP